ncbi:MAG: CGNR zinc finger domain-containing protein [Gemmatimonadales bacterium]
MPELSLVGNHPALDFTNTVGGWDGDRVREDRLRDYGDLLLWSRKAGLLAPADARALERQAAIGREEAGRVLERARDLRSALYRTLTAALSRQQPPQADLARLNREVARARAAERLVPGRDTFAWKAGEEPSLDRPVQLVAAATARLLVEGPLVRIHRCPGENCGWLFLDTSRGGRRRWCDMATCGNLDKVRRFRRRAAD